MKVALVTDGASDLPADIALARGIEIAPHHVIWGTQVYTDGINMTNTAFYERLMRDPQLPKTSQPSAGEFADKYRAARESHHAEAVLCITTSHQITGAYNSALLARDMVDFPVEVLDSQTATIPLGLAVLVAADACERDAPLAEVMAIAQRAASQSRFFFTLDTLDFLYRGGRIGNAKRLIGMALSIKPMLHIEAGAVAAGGSVRTRKAALARLLDIAAEYKDKRPLRVGVIHSIAPEVDEFSERLRALLQPDQFIQTLACSPVGVYAGPRGLGFGLVYGV